MKIEKDDILIREFTESDLTLMLKWLTDARVLEFYEGRDTAFTMEALTDKYLGKIPSGFRVIIEYKKQSIGYAQMYQLDEKLLRKYKYQNYDDTVFAIDQFIGEPEYCNHGIGSTFLKIITRYLKTYKKANIVLLDPRKNNLRAIRAYEKAGFKIIKVLYEHELFEGKRGDCLLLEKKL